MKIKIKTISYDNKRYSYIVCAKYRVQSFFWNSFTHTWMTTTEISGKTLFNLIEIGVLCNKRNLMSSIKRKYKIYLLKYQSSNCSLCRTKIK